MAGEACEEDNSRNNNIMVSGGFCNYSDITSSSNPTIQTHLVNQIQGFHDESMSSPGEMFNLSSSTAGMEMMMGFSSKNLQQQHQQQEQEQVEHQQQQLMSDSNSGGMWRGLFSKQGNINNNINKYPAAGRRDPHPPSSSSSKSVVNNDHLYDQQAAELNIKQAAEAGAADDDDHFTTATGISEASSDNHHHHHHQALIMGIGAPADSAPWQEENRTTSTLLLDHDSSILMRCVFPCQGNERPPSQGLSLSLSSNNNIPSSIGLQSFELIRHTSTHHHINPQEEMRFMMMSSQSSRDPINGLFGKLGEASLSSSSSILTSQQSQQQQQMMQLEDGCFVGKAATANSHHHQQGQILFQLRNCKFLAPAQQLLNEFCSLGTKQTDAAAASKHVKLQQCSWDHDTQNGSAISSSSSFYSRKQSLYSLEFMELQKRKTKLLSMLEEVDRRYKKYSDQMKGVVSSFEGVAGGGAASVYSGLASKAMSRHFRCLRDGIVGQIHATKKAMGEKDAVAPGTTRGETPRLRILDQTLRQHRAFQQMSMMETHPWRPQRGLPERSVSLLRAWLFEHFLHPYPSDVDKHILARQTGLSRSQVSNWFINARVRLWKPMVEEMYLEETKETDNMGGGGGGGGCSSYDLDVEDNINGRRPNSSTDDQKRPTPLDQLIHGNNIIDSECLSSMISNKNDLQDSSPKPHKTSFHHYLHNQHHQMISSVASFGGAGAMDLEFSSSYNNHVVHNAHGGTSTTVSSNYGAAINDGGNHNLFNAAGVSLTLGLQQHGSAGAAATTTTTTTSTGGVSLAFSPSTSQTSLFYNSRDVVDIHMEDCQPVQYSLLDGEGRQALPYRNLMGAQLLHDLAG